MKKKTLKPIYSLQLFTIFLLIITGEGGGIRGWINFGILISLTVYNVYCEIRG